MKHVFIINPRAGKGKALELIRPQIEAYINEHNLDAEIHVPDSPHARAGLYSGGGVEGPAGSLLCLRRRRNAI